MTMFACGRCRAAIYAPHFAHDTDAIRGTADAGGDGGSRLRPVPLPAPPTGDGVGEAGMPTPCEPLLRHVLRDEALTRGLDDIEARMLVEWVADWTELLAEAARTDDDAWSCVRRLCRRGRAIGRFVHLWCEQNNPGAASQLAAAERFNWPLPTHPVEAPDLMHHILTWENSHPGK